MNYFFAITLLISITLCSACNNDYKSLDAVDQDLIDRGYTSSWDNVTNAYE